MGNRLSSKDPKGNPLTYYDYDPLSRLEEVIQPGDIHTLYDFDSHDNLVAVTDGNGNSTTFVLDDKGRVYQERSPDSGTTTYQYDPVGNMTVRTDARGITVSYSYDALNRLTLVNFPTDTDFLYTYDTCNNGKGRLCQVVDQSGTTTYSYSPKGKLAQEDRLILGVNYTTGYQYDGNGNLEVLTYPSGRTVRYVYDDADQPTDVLTTSPGGAEQTVASSISYYPFGPSASMTHGNSLVRTAGYDLQYRVTNIQTGSAQDLTYIPDPNGNLQDIINNLDSNKNKSFSYDSLNRLYGTTGPWGNLSWTYDSVGNRLTYTDAAGTTNYSYYTDTNRLQALTGATSKTFSYTNAGNTETEDTRQYVYNENNRLTQISDGVVIGEYTHNGYGQRVIKIVQGTTTVFLYDQNGTLIGESDGVSFEEYIYLRRTPIANASGQDLFFVHADHLDTPQVMTNTGGASVWNLEARPFGDGGNATGTEILNLRFPGQYHDEESGLAQNFFRDYAPKLGRYIEADPIGLSGGMNLYGYADNSPTTKTDRFGLIADRTSQAYLNYLCRIYPAGCAKPFPLPPKPDKCEQEWRSCIFWTYVGGLGFDVACTIVCTELTGGQGFICWLACRGGSAMGKAKCKQNCDAGYRRCKNPEQGCEDEDGCKQ
jgi:RHS repeat-associated protein